MLGYVIHEDDDETLSSSRADERLRIQQHPPDAWWATGDAGRWEEEEEEEEEDKEEYKDKDKDEDEYETATATIRARSVDGRLLRPRPRPPVLRVVGRYKDVIRTGGENVHAGEVEGILGTCPGVKEVAVVGVPHRRWGEMVTALVVLEPHVVALEAAAAEAAAEASERVRVEVSPVAVRVALVGVRDCSDL